MNLKRHFNTLFCEDVHPFSTVGLSAFRIGLALLTAWDLVEVLLQSDFLFSERGAFPPSWRDEFNYSPFFGLGRLAQICCSHFVVML